MNKYLLISFLMFTVLKTQAQDYLISFAGTGTATAVSTVKVDNLTSGTTLTMNGGDILHLTATVGMAEADAGTGALQIYPNPMAEQATLTVVARENGNSVIDIVDASGKSIYRTSSMLAPGTHSFRLSGLGEGMYFVKVTGNGYACTAKLLSHSKVKRKAAIEYISSGPHKAIKPLKSTLATIEMLYNTGDRLLFKGISGIYSTIVPDVPTGSKTITFKFVACTDKDNNNYPVVQIGTQIWMAENLKTTRYSDGTLIPLVRDNTTWGKLSTPGYCWYNNDSVTHKETYGSMYNWYAVNTAKLAPEGWRVPTDADWSALTTYLGGETVAGGILKETGLLHWKTPNESATNQYGFSALPGGYRITNGAFNQIGNFGYWWSSTEYDTSTSWYRGIFYGTADVYNNISKKFYGYSVRCVKE